LRNFICLIIIFHFFLICSPEQSYGYEGAKDSAQGPNSEIEWEYMTPVEQNRQIKTLSLNILFSKKPSLDERLAFYTGATITRAWGNVIHLSVKQENSAFGIGPVYLLRYKALQLAKSSLLLDISGSLIFYSENFPAGGDFYNFMWRIGPKFTYQISDNCLLNIGYKLMHVSNGQWSDNPSTSHNPAYNANGISLSITKLF
jgi:lipid A 3-O-deacylase